MVILSAARVLRYDQLAATAGEKSLSDETSMGNSNTVILHAARGLRYDQLIGCNCRRKVIVG